MSELGIIFAIILFSWVYASLHEANKENRGSRVTQAITLLLTSAAINLGVVGAFWK